MLSTFAIKFSSAGVKTWTPDEDCVLIGAASLVSTYVISRDPKVTTAEFSNPGLGSDSDENVLGICSPGLTADLPHIPCVAGRPYFVASSGVGTLFLYFLT